MAGIKSLVLPALKSSNLKITCFNSILGYIEKLFVAGYLGGPCFHSICSFKKRNDSRILEERAENALASLELLLLKNKQTK